MMHTSKSRFWLVCLSQIKKELTTDDQEIEETA